MAPPTPHTHKQTSGEASIVVSLMNQIEGLRGDFKETTETIIKKIDDQGRDTASKIDTLREDVSEIKQRLARGSERIEHMRRDIDGHVDKCAKIHPTNALEKKSSPTESSTPKLAWWVVLLAGGALAWVGERGVKFFINGIADPPAVVAPATSPTP